MSNVKKMAQVHGTAYEAKMKHIDELLERASKGLASKSEVTELNAELEELRAEREKLMAEIEEMKKATREEWQEETIEEAGPMILWEAVAKRLESLVERIGR